MLRSRPNLRRAGFDAQALISYCWQGSARIKICACVQLFLQFTGDENRTSIMVCNDQTYAQIHPTVAKLFLCCCSCCCIDAIAGTTIFMIEFDLHPLAGSGSTGTMLTSYKQAQAHRKVSQHAPISSSANSWRHWTNFHFRNAFPCRFSALEKMRLMHANSAWYFQEKQ